VRRRRAIAAGAVLLAIAAIATAVALAAAPSSSGPAGAFLDRYMDKDGRVVRHDQGGDTVSEGQAYAMLLAAAIGDRGRFDLAWGWSKRHLQRSDGLLAWHWQHGRVTSRQPATDADLDAAWALSIAGRRFHHRPYTRAARQMARGILDNETAPIAGKLVLLAGPWARSSGTLNPSYFSPRAYAALGQVDPDPRWHKLTDDSRRLLVKLPSPPPDWAKMDGSGVHPTAPYSWNAFRVPVRYAASCNAADRAVVKRYWPAVGRTDNPVATVGAAAAAPDAGIRTALLNQAAQEDAAHPTYYGAAWVALGHELLASADLGCPP
jgi:endoglucanase